MTASMTWRWRFAPLAVAVLATLLCSGQAQSAELDEAIGGHGVVQQNLALTAAQKSAIYNAVMRQHIRSFSTLIEPAVGAPVPPSAPLSTLPERADIPDTLFLKYAMVEDDVVVVDPITMRVVDVIQGGTVP